MKNLILIAIITLLLVLIYKQYKDNQKEYYRAITTAEVVTKIEQAVKLYVAYQTYQPVIKQYLQYIKNKEKLKADICQWTKDKTLLNAIAYILMRIKNKAKSDRQVKVLDGMVKVIQKLNLLSIAFSGLPSFVKDIIPQPHKSNLDLFFNINEFTSKMLRQALDLGDCK